MTSFLRLEAVAKRFATTPVLSDLDLAVPRGTILSLLGASGCGKSTLLRLIAGFEMPDAGHIALDGRTLVDARSTVPPHRRGIGFVPQEGSLFPNLSVGRNIGFGLPRAGRDTKVAALLDLVGLAGHADRPPHTLSGGQQQRVALARALAVEPALLLLDEPFNALDAALRQELCRDVRRILKARDATAILVTHDRDEAFGLADQVAIMSAGRILQVGSPRAVYSEPASLAAAALTGPALCLPGHLRDGRVETPLGSLATVGSEGVAEGRVVALLRPEQVVAAPRGQGIAATVVDLTFSGPLVWLDLRLPVRDERVGLKVCWPADQAPAPGAEVEVGVVTPARVFPAP